MSEHIDILKLVEATVARGYIAPVVASNPLAKVVHNTNTKRDPATVLMTQMQTLDEIFSALVSMAGKASYPEQVEGCMRTALRVQGQCVRTVQALASLGKPGHVSFVQANITRPPQPQDIVDEK